MKVFYVHSLTKLVLYFDNDIPSHMLQICNVGWIIHNVTFNVAGGYQETYKE